MARRPGLKKKAIIEILTAEPGISPSTVQARLAAKGLSAHTTYIGGLAKMLRDGDIKADDDNGSGPPQLGKRTVSQAEYDKLNATISPSLTILLEGQSFVRKAGGFAQARQWLEVMEWLEVLEVMLTEPCR